MKKWLLVLILLFPTYKKATDIQKTLVEAQLIKCETADYAYYKVDDEKMFIRLLSFHKTSGNLDNIIDDYVCETLTNANKIELEFVDTAKYDEYNRQYAYVYVDGNLLQETLIKKGYGQVSNILDNYPYLNELCDIQKQAIIKRLGIWSYQNIEENYCQSGIDLTNNEPYVEENQYEEAKNNYSYLYTMLFISSATLALIIGYRYAKR